MECPSPSATPHAPLPPPAARRPARPAQLFKVKRAAFEALPKWKKDSEKKRVGLF